MPLHFSILCLYHILINQSKQDTRPVQTHGGEGRFYLWWEELQGITGIFAIYLCLLAGVTYIVLTCKHTFFISDLLKVLHDQGIRFDVQGLRISSSMSPLQPETKDKYMPPSHTLSTSMSYTETTACHAMSCQININTIIGTPNKTSHWFIRIFKCHRTNVPEQKMLLDWSLGCSLGVFPRAFP